MPNKTEPLSLSPGAIYIETPEGMEPLATGGPLHATEILPPDADYSTETVIPLTTPAEASFKIDFEVNPAYQAAAHAAAAIHDCVCWALCNRRRLVHLAVYTKKHRTRKKNVKRIIREYIKEG